MRWEWEKTKKRGEKRGKGEKKCPRREDRGGKENRCAERSGNYTRAEPGRMSRTLAGSWFERVTGGRAGNIGYIRADTGRLVSITIAPPNLPCSTRNDLRSPPVDLSNQPPIVLNSIRVLKNFQKKKKKTRAFSMDKGIRRKYEAITVSPIQWGDRLIRRRIGHGRGRCANSRALARNDESSLRWRKGREKELSTK